MGMGITSLKWEGFGTKNPFPYISSRACAHTTSDQIALKKFLYATGKLCSTFRENRSVKNVTILSINAGRTLDNCPVGHRTQTWESTSQVDLRST